MERLMVNVCCFDVCDLLQSIARKDNLDEEK